MALEPHVKQQIRFQIEASLEDFYKLEEKSLGIVGTCLNRGIATQYQLFNRFKSKRKNQKEKQKQLMLHWEELVDKTLVQISSSVPNPVSKRINPLRKLVSLSRKKIEQAQDNVDEVLVDYIQKQLNNNREMVDRFLNWAQTEVKDHQQTMSSRIKEQLSNRFPVSDEEHFALAKDITHLVRRVEVPKD